MSARPLAAAMALALVACEGPDLGFPWDFERMLEQPRYDTYGRSAFFEDERAMREPPEGTVPHGAAPEREDARDAPPDRALLARGRDRFGVFCAPCHGLDGRADTPVAASMSLRPPPSLHEPVIRGRGPEHVARVAARGYGLMPGYGELLTPADLRAVVHWVQVLWLSESVPLDRLPPDLRARARAALPPREPGS